MRKIVLYVFRDLESSAHSANKFSDENKKELSQANRAKNFFQIPLIFKLEIFKKTCTGENDQPWLTADHDSTFSITHGWS